MRIYFSPEEEFAERFQRSLGVWNRVFEKVGTILVVVGVALGVVALWNDYERLPVILLLSTIGVFIYTCYALLVGILAGLAYLNERFAKKMESANSTK